MKAIKILQLFCLIVLAGLVGALGAKFAALPEVGQVQARPLGNYNYTNYPSVEIGNADVGDPGNLRVGNGTPGVTLNGEDAYIEGTLEVDGAVQHDGAVTNNGAVTNANAVANNAAVTWGSAASEVATFSSISLTSPTKTINVANKRWITLNSDANVTALLPTGGTLGQVVTFRSGTGSNTMQFDDATSCGLTGNIVLTESAAATADSLTLICVSADGDEWSELNASVN